MTAISAATYERARRLANVSLKAVNLQCSRIQSDNELEDESFVFRRWADFDFLIVAITRLRRAAALASTIPEIKSIICEALRDFDATLPGLKKMRAAAEHIDDYALDKGHNKKITRTTLEVSTIYPYEHPLKACATRSAI